MTSLNTNARSDITSYRVLVVDDDENYRQRLVSRLNSWGYEVFAAEGQDWDLIDSAIQLARTHRCHIALVDMILFKDDPYDVSGLELVAKIKPTQSIVVSNHSGEAVKIVQAIKSYGAEYFVDKSRVPGVLKETIEAVLREYWPQAPEVQWLRGILSGDIVKHLFPDNQTVPSDQVDIILRRLFPDAETLMIEPFRGANHHNHRMPQHHSIVLEVTIQTSHTPQIPDYYLAKLGQGEHILAEINNYKKYVYRKLKRGYFAQLEEPVRLWDLSGANYNFGCANINELKRFGVYYEKHDHDDINKCIEHFFQEVWGFHYRNLPPDNTHKYSLFVAYSDVWGTRWQDRVNAFPNMNESLVHPLISGEELPNPVVWMRKCVRTRNDPRGDKSTLPQMRTAITHGDLRSNNLFVTPKEKRVFVSDYKRTGPGPILQDFVKLEIDILINLLAPHKDNLFFFITLSVAILEPTELGKIEQTDIQDASCRKALLVIQKLREIAYNCTQVNDMRHYLWGLLFNAVYIATLLQHRDEDAPRRDRALLLGGLICHRLDSWEQQLEWPPISWGIPLHPEPWVPSGIGEIQNQIDLLEVYRARLRILVIQLAQNGISAPICLDITNTRKRIGEIKSRLRNKMVQVQDDMVEMGDECA